MKIQFLKKLIFLILLAHSALGQNGKFSFTLPTRLTTSAGVFKNDSVLVKTLWNNEKYDAGTYTKEWDGTDDNGNTISSPDATYKIKVLSNNVQYNWQGVIGNTSDSSTGNSVHRGYFYCMRGLAFANNGYGYFCTGYVEGGLPPVMAKFNVAKPNTRINIYNGNQGNTWKADINFVCTDNTNVYWAALDSYNTQATFVWATKVSNDAEVSFSSGTPYTVVHGRTYPSVIAKTTSSDTMSLITGMAVQKAGNYLFVARARINEIQVLNKTTGALVQTITQTTPRGLCIDASDNLWVISNGVVRRHTVNSDGTLSTATLTLTGITDPQATQVSPNGTKIAVTDAAIATQQVKFFNTTTGALLSTFGTAGGYTTDATVANDKFYFRDIRTDYANPRLLTFLAYQSDSSLWVSDPGNFRVQHYNSSMTYIDRIMSLGATYNVWADRHNPTKVFAGYHEYLVDYSQPLTGSTGWQLVKNWGANVTSNYDRSELLKFQVTLSNGRTYGTMRRNEGREIVELMPGGTMRFTGVLTLNNTTKLLCDDGSIQESAFSVIGGNPTYIFKRYALTGFDGSNNPLWSTTPEILATATANSVIGNPASYAQNQILSSRNKVVLYYINAWIKPKPNYIPHQGFHLGLMQKGASDVYQFQTEKSNYLSYLGDYPPPGFFDVGNGVGNAGGNVNILDRNVITSYHGEFWKGSQTNKYNHYYDNGLAIGQFGTTRPEANLISEAAPGMAGNALNPFLLKDSTSGNLYLYHGDESDHAGIHRWKISGLNTITEQVITIPYPSAFAVPVTNYTDLMAGLPFNDTLDNNTAGWTRLPINDTINWTVSTSKQTYNSLKSNDVTVSTMLTTSATNSVSRDLGTNNVTTNWKIAGELSFPTSNLNNYYWWKMYLEVLDANGKVLTTFYPAVNSTSTSTSLYANTVAFGTVAGTYLTGVNNLVPFEVKIVSGAVTFTYGNYTPVVTTILDATANWRTPKTLRMRFINSNPTGTQRGQSITVKDFKFYKDYLLPAGSNLFPSVNAGADQVITLPVNNTVLTGNATDSDGTISSFSWSKISGPSAGDIVTPNLAASVVNNLVQGIYKFELTVADNVGAIAKDTLQITVSAASNMFPSVNAGADQVITLPVNNTTLAGSGTDPDGAISSYLWTKISGPSGYSVATPNASTTVINSMQQGVYLFELTVTDKKGAVAKDTVQVTVNSTTNLLPTANAGLDKAITLPIDSTTLTGIGTDSDGTISSYLWTKISGPSGCTIATASTSATLIESLIEGIYQFELTVSDNKGATGKDTIIVRVRAANITNKLPTAYAGSAIDMVLPTNYAFLNGVGSDADGIIVTTNWKVLSGPAGYSITNPNLSTTKIENLFQGIYKLEFSVIDNAGGIARDSLTITVSSPRLSGFSSNQFSVYPNPIKDIANLSINSSNMNTKLSIAVMDQGGKIVGYRELVTTNTLTLVKLDMSNLSNGNYIITLRFDDGKKLSTKVVKYGG